MTCRRRTARQAWRGVAFSAAAIACIACSNSPPATAPSSATTTDPLQAQFITEDIGRFWHAYDAGGRDGSIAAFQTHYIDLASSGLRDFIEKRSVTAIRLADMVKAYPRYFAAVRPNMMRLASDEIRSTLVAGYWRMKALYPAAVFPPVTFVVGRFSTGGTTSLSGMLIGAEFLSRDASTPVDELGAFQRNNVHGADSVTMIVAHEHVHILQANARALWNNTNKTLLDQSLMEGSADFIGSLVSGGNINAALFPYALSHEAELWAEFKAAMNGADVTRWLYNQGAATGDRPGDLGYFFGYRIAEAYYQRATDKTAAIRDIIEMRSGAAFLHQSGYAP